MRTGIKDILLFMLTMSPKLTLLSFMPLPLLALAVQQGSRLTYKRFAVVQEKFADLTSLAQESLTGIRSLRSYAREGQVSERFAQRSAEYVELNLAYFRVHAAIRGEAVDNILSRTALEAGT